MTLHLNDYGRAYVFCDGGDCPENIIDLPPDFEAANRIVRTFFGWAHAPGLRHHCKSCHRAAQQKEKTRCG